MKNFKAILLGAILIISCFTKIYSQEIIKKEKNIASQKEVLFDNVSNKASATCTCVAPPPNYYKEYPSAGLVFPTVNPMPLYIPTSELSTTNKIHFAFATGPCYTTVSNPCYGYYKATVNGHVVNSSSVGYGSQTHIEIPISYLVSGSNTISVQGVCGTTTCSLSSTVVNIGNPPASSGSINLVKECCSVTDHIPPYATHFTGQVKFKMTGTVSNAVLEITSSTGTTYENFVNGGYTNCYSKPVTIKIVNNITHLPVSGSTINSLTTPYSYNPARFDISCMNIIKIDIKKDIFIKLFPETPRIFDEFTEASTFDPSDLNGLRLISNFTNRKTKEKIIITSLVELDEKGDIYLNKIEDVKSNLRAIKITSIPYKHEYVGHVTLLR